MSGHSSDHRKHLPNQFLLFTLSIAVRTHSFFRTLSIRNVKWHYLSMLVCMQCTISQFRTICMCVSRKLAIHFTLGKFPVRYACEKRVVAVKMLVSCLICSFNSVWNSFLILSRTKMSVVHMRDERCMVFHVHRVVCLSFGPCSFSDLQFLFTLPKQPA